ncbi:MAG: SIS domain-containing protein, partial [Clostridia bacterium]|nr:SIS domain-containing protein [Clostridia bacterium]
MCGIFGVISQNAYDKVFNGLKLLQYRGYDSCGIAYFKDGFKIEKAVGSLEKLKQIDIKNEIAFGHTRWATNGVVNIENAHPHVSYDNKYFLVHNGIIKNAEEIKQTLISEGVNFYSSTDTEVIANYIAYNCKDKVLGKVLPRLFDDLEGSFSLIVGNNVGELYLIKKFSPLNVLIADDGIYISSDISSLKDGKLYSLKDNDILKVTKDKVEKLNGDIIEFIDHKNTFKSLSLKNHSYFMEKEIFETPQAIKNTFYSIKDIPIREIFAKYEKLTLIGCGTAYNSCLVGEYLFKNELEKDVETILASNYNVKSKIKNNHLHIIVSQSGETADCIKVAEQVKHYDGKILIITNERLSTIAKMADYHIFTDAEKEIAVASTKTYSCQLFIFAYVCHILKDINYQIDIDQFCKDLDEYITTINIDDVANRLQNIDRIIMIAKDIDYITLLEASLKIREIDYVFTLPMYSGELKHGTLS